MGKYTDGARNAAEVIRRMNEATSQHRGNPYHDAKGLFTTGPSASAAQLAKQAGIGQGYKATGKPGDPARITDAKKALKALPKEAQTESGAERLFRRMMETNPTFYHESPGDVSASMNSKGIMSEYGTFASVGVPSSFVFGPKTEVQFRLPASERSYVVPDMIYGNDGSGLGPHQHFLLSHPKLTGGYVAYNESVPRHHITSIKVHKGG